jgi:ESS family glutamate:Na+ symporter
MEFNAWSLFIDASLISILLIIGVLIRAWVPFVQSLMLPASVIAGVLGFVFGPNVLGILPFSSQMATYPAILIVLVFACLALTDSLDLKKMGKPIGAFASYGVLMYSAQVLVGVLAAVLLLTPVWGTPDGFGLLLVAGWAGGFGSAAAMGTVFTDAGWAEATTLGFTSATVGLIIGFVGGIAMAKVGARRGHAAEFRGMKSLPNHLRTGLLRNVNDRESSGQSTMSAGSIESAALQIAVVLSISFEAYMLAEGAKLIIPGVSLPLFSLAFLVGLIVRIISKKTGADHYLDSTSQKSISGLSTDLLIVCGIASIVPQVVGSYWLPLTILFVLGLALCLTLVFFVAPRMLGENWFEKSIFTWGWATGAVATGIALLRIIDPKLKTKTMETFAIAYLPLMPVEVVTISFAPFLALAGLSWASAGIWGLLAALAITLPWVFRWVPAKQTLDGTKVPAPQKLNR